jgi:polyphosphate kinase
MTAKKTGAQEETAFFNRELSWLRFNRRVLGEALDKTVKPLERLKFLCIVGSNLDEFFQVRVASLNRQLALGNYITDPSGMSPAAQLEEIFREAGDLIRRQYRCLHEEVLPQLAENGLVFVLPKDCPGEQKSFLADYFDREVFPVLTPFRVEKTAGIPSTGNLKLHAAFLLEGAHDPQAARTACGAEARTGPFLAAVRIPSTLPRLIFLPAGNGKVFFTLLEYAVLEYAHALFPGYEIRESLLFRVTRDSDIGVDEERDEDFVNAMQEALASRQYSAVVRLSVSGTSPVLREELGALLGVAASAVFESPGPLDMRSLNPEAFAGFDSLRDEKWKPVTPRDIPDDEPVREAIARKDILLHHPYDSFQPVLRLLSEAASDPDVLAVKITLYRTSGDSPIIDALENAARAGKQVTAFVELKARFDEERNIEWAERLQRAGVIVVYGVARLKVHAKALLVIRREKNAVRRYVHLSTGNYNDTTSRLYTDLGFFTCRDDIAYDVSLFFNAITGYSVIPALKTLVMSPTGMKNRLVALIGREAERSGRETPGLIIAKMNSLADPDIIEALYRAAQKQVKIALIVRGICMLVPREHISVLSIVDRFLEHSRAFYFYNAGAEEVYLSSADWMPRNLERRVELMFPIEQKDLKKRVIHILRTCLRDDTQAHELKPDGSYEKRTCDTPKKAVRSQRVFYEEAREEAEAAEKTSKKEFTVRRGPPKGQ